MMRSTYVLALAALASAPLAQAAPTSYQLTLVIEQVALPDFASLGFADCDALVNSAAPPTFGCDWLAGGTAEGQFQVDADTSLLADGTYPFLPLAAWSVQVGEVKWDILAPSDYVGFRDGLGRPCGNGGTGFSQINPGLRITGGQVTGLCGGVFGSRDEPFMDFDGLYGAGHFGALDPWGVSLRGRYQIEAVPEPGTIALAGLALAALGAGRWRRRAWPTDEGRR